MRKIGRNDICPCGSNKKFKKCCEGKFPSPPRIPKPKFRVEPIPVDRIPPEVLRMVEQQTAAVNALEAQRRGRYGLVRPEIVSEFQGYKFVAIGSRLLYLPADRCHFLSDVLQAYVPQLFGKQWFEAEIAKPPNQRHPVMQWRIKGLMYMNAQPRQADGFYSAPMTGQLMAYITFAYDLYVVDHNSRLDARLLDRLKHVDQFQGARHELFAEATCLRAGFSIEHENEADGSTKHAEFTATHKTALTKVSVEAKSKHRAGVLGQPGEPEDEGSLNLRFGKLLNSAIAKKVPHPLVVFLDMNMPYRSADRLLSPRPGPPPVHPLIQTTLDKIRAEHGGKDPVNLLLITNHPQHYTKDDELAQRPHMLAQISQVPVTAVRVDVLWAIANAANLYGNIPNALPEQQQVTVSKEFQAVLNAPITNTTKAS